MLALETKNVGKVFPGVIALKDLDFELEEGEVHCIVGENGAGKSTFIKILSGAYIDYYGEIIVNGEKKVYIDSPEIARNVGIAAIQQERDLIREVPGYENIFLANEIVHKGFLINKRDELIRAKELIGKFNIDINLTKTVSELTVAEQEVVAICKALSLNCKILLIDEATAPLSREERLSLFKVIKGLKEHGISVIYISHNIEELFEIGDRVTILRDGEKVKTLAVRETNIKEIIELMIGKEYKEFKKEYKELSKNEVVLKVENLFVKDRLFDISFDLKKGEILGICGLVGSNKYYISLVLFGLLKKDSGDIFLKGRKRKVNLKSPIQSLMLGIGLMPDNRREKGLIGCLSLRDNILLSSINKNKNFIVGSNYKTGIAKKFREDLKIVSTDVFQKVENLSGGNQQKVIFSKWLAANIEVLILIEPTEGIDVNARSEMYKMLKEFTNNGKSVILVSSDLGEIVNISDRVLSMKNGRITDEFEGSSINKKKLMESILVNDKYNKEKEIIKSLV